MATAHHIHGRVLADGSPRAGVVVSDGRQVALTDAEGWFHLPCDLPNLPAGVESEPLVWICVPSGFRATGPWYQPASQLGIEFHLARDPGHREAFSFVFLTDLHLIRGRSAAKQPIRPLLEEIRRLSPPPAFFVNGGDVEIDNDMGRIGLELLSDLNLPGRHVMGNHDLCVGSADPYATFRSQLGPERYSWDYGRFHFVTLCGLVPNPAQSGWRNVEGELTEEELTWLAADLELAGGRPVIAFIHIPPLSTFPQRHRAIAGQEPAWEVRRADRLLEICRRFNVKLVLSGHFHENERFIRDGTIFQASAAVCGHWWERDGRPACNLDGSPKGYRIIYIDGDRFQSIYRGVGVRNELQIQSPRPGQVVRGDLLIEVDVIDGGAEDTRVECRLGQGEWNPMIGAPLAESPGTLSSAHRWTVRLPAPAHAGTHLLSVRCWLPGGVVTTEQIDVLACAG